MEKYNHVTLKELLVNHPELTNVLVNEPFEGLVALAEETWEELGVELFVLQNGEVLDTGNRVVEFTESTSEGVLYLYILSDDGNGLYTYHLGKLKK